MHRAAQALLGLLLPALLVACRPAPLPVEAPRPLRVGVSDDYPPFSLDGEGFDVEVARRFAADQGSPVEWVSFRWPELEEAVLEHRFDVAMSGVTWRPRRDVRGWMSRAVARGGPCVVGPEGASRLAVNRGGILEVWARSRYPDRELVVTDDNRALPRLLRERVVEAVVTDRFEARHVAGAGDPVRCEPATDRKVYWVAPARADQLGPRLDQWLRANEAAIDALRIEHFGARAPLDQVDHLIDLIGRRLELMPAVAAWKHARGEPLEDPERERLVVLRSTEAAAARGLDPESVERLFRLQIELAKAVQARNRGGTESGLDLERELRPAILRLGDRIVEALAGVETPVTIDPARLDVLGVLLRPAEIAELGAALESLCSAAQRAGGACPPAAAAAAGTGRAAPGPVPPPRDAARR
jgi:chorismate mutase-like protein